MQMNHHGSADIHVQTPGPGDYAAVLTLHGEHDLSTAQRLTESLAVFLGPVLVDLGECQFIDSTIIAALVRCHRQLAREGYRLDVRCAEGSAIHRTLLVAGADGLFRLV
jgi:anti-anti-sigma factor